jgi:hypothetical protein
VVRCGDIGQNGNGGHAHNDLLSYEFGRSVPLIVDSGNYAYTFDLEARNEGRSTRAHNTVAVDGEEINPIPAGAAFKLRQVAHPRVESWQPDGAEPLLTASHDGYGRLPGVARHRRTFRLDRRSGALAILDEVLGAGRHTVESFLHLTPDAAVTLDGQRATLTLGSERIVIEAGGDAAPLELDEGWVSESYGTRAPAPVLIVRHHGELPALLTLKLVPQAGD